MADSEHDEAQVELAALLAGLAHEMRNALNSVSSGAQLLVDRGSSKPMRERLLPVVLEGAERMQSILDAIEHYSTADGPGQRIDLQAAMDVIRRLLIFTTRGVRVHCDLGGLHFSLINPRDSLMTLLRVHRFLLATSTTDLWIKARMDGDEMHLRLEVSLSSDDSQLLPSEALDSSRRIMAALGGRLVCEPSSKRGTAVHLYWPSTADDAVHVEDPLR